MQEKKSRFVSAATLASLASALLLAGLVGRVDSAQPEATGPTPKIDDVRVESLEPLVSHTRQVLERGRLIFRYDTMGSERFFTDALHLNDALATVSPLQALALGVKVDTRSIPLALKRAIRHGEVDLTDPAVTVALIKMDAVVGVMGKVSDDGHLTEVGITCALCHSTVDDRFAPGLGERLDGWPNRDLDVGTILSVSPDLTPFAQLLGVDVATVKAVLTSWGPGKFDAHLNLDGKAFRPDGKPAAVLIPPAFGLAGVNLHTYEGWGSVPYWNAFVGNLEMSGSGRFFDPRLADPAKHPVSAAAGFDDVFGSPDRVTSKLADLQMYQLALAAPTPPAGSFDAAAATRGKVLFNGKARCSTCHTPPLYTEPGWNLHTPAEIGIDSFQADRGPTGRYRTTPLKGLWTHTKGGFYHDGRFPTLLSVVDHYDEHLDLGLSAAEKADLVEFLKSL